MSFAVFSYASAALAYALLTLVLVLMREGRRQGQRVLVAVAGTALWGGAVAALVAWGPADLDLTPVADALRAALWVFCLVTALPPTARTFTRSVRAAAVVLVALTAVAPFVAPGRENLALLTLSILAFLPVEQILRNAAQEQKKVIKSFLWGIAAILTYDLFVFSDAVLFDAVDPALWAPRGLLAALAVPFFVLAAKRHPDWEETLFVSREFVFYSATLTGVGIYLIGMALGGFVIREQGGEWGAAIQLGYLAAALALLAFILSSARLKSQLRVFISKHFYRNRYDYRDEWLRLIRTLSDVDQQLPLEQRSIKALCAIMESDGGQLWLDRDGRSVYEPYAAWQDEFPTRELTGGSPLVRFLEEQQWVVDSRQYKRDPERYQHAFRDAPEELPANSLIVPLVHDNALLGLMRLKCTPSMRELNYEDHDLLKTAGRQVAAFLAHDLARERLAETQQFEAYNKLSAFVMHDLKNLLAQQALLVQNAKKFGHRPEFLEDAIRTLDNGVQRMRRLLRQLAQDGAPAQDQRVELNKLILRAVSACADDGKAPCSFADDSTFWVRANPDQLGSVLTNVLRNAQEATKNGATVAITLGEWTDGRVAIEVRDNGEGMSEEFIRRRLFKPFQSTKGTAGMGIGAYHAREVVRGLGGDIVVTSELGRGTTVRILLPQLRPAEPHEERA